MSEPALNTSGSAVDSPHGLLRPAIIIPFVLVALIWGSTWWVITGQIDEVPASWSIAYRFMLATPAMFVVAIVTGKSLRLGRGGHLLAMFVGLSQFCANFHFVYRSEMHLTSGIVAVMFGLLILPNVILGWLFLGQKASLRFFLGSLLAIAGVSLLLWHEAQVSRLDGDIGLGILLTIGGILAASIANVVQANKTGQKLPMASLLAWSMLYGTIIDIALAWSTIGPPVIPDDPQYWMGVTYLALAGSVVTFPLYYTLVRRMGAGPAAYNSVSVIIVAMAISTVLEGYQWSALAVAGALLAMAGMVLALRARQPRGTQARNAQSVASKADNPSR